MSPAPPVVPKGFVPLGHVTSPRPALPGPRSSFRALLRDEKRPAVGGFVASGASTPMSPASLPAASHDGSPRTARPPHLDPRDRNPPDDPLDPFHRRRQPLSPQEALGNTSAAAGPHFFVAPQALGEASPGVAVETHAKASLEDLLPALVRRVAWSGDGRRGTMRLEIGAGALRGATLVVHAEGGRVRVQLDAPGGLDADEWRERITRRLARRGIEAEDVEVTS